MLLLSFASVSSAFLIFLLADTNALLHPSMIPLFADASSSTSNNHDEKDAAGGSGDDNGQRKLTRDGDHHNSIDGDNEHTLTSHERSVRALKEKRLEEARLKRIEMMGEGEEEEEEDDADEEEEEDNSPQAVSMREQAEKKKRWNGHHIHWMRSWREAKVRARRERRPILLQFWKEKDCPACAQLEKTLRKSPEVEVLSEHYVMLLLADTDVPDEEQFTTLPQYSPRTYFFNYKGRMLDVINEQGTFPENLHYYVTADQLVASMKDVLRDESGFETFRAI